MTNHYELVIIGSGAGGGTLARCLAEAGKKVLVLERGDWLPREPQNWDPSEVFQNNRNVSIDLWKD
jgi:choline dehydrogenase-like flavoprotein